MLQDNYVTFEIGKAKHIALVAHDGKKKELVEWCDQNKEILKKSLFMWNRNDIPTDCRENRVACKRL